MKKFLIAIVMLSMTQGFITPTSDAVLIRSWVEKQPLNNLEVSILIACLFVPVLWPLCLYNSETGEPQGLNHSVLIENGYTSSEVDQILTETQSLTQSAQKKGKYFILESQDTREDFIKALKEMGTVSDLTAQALAAINGL